MNDFEHLDLDAARKTAQQYNRGPGSALYQFHSTGCVVVDGVHLSRMNFEIAQALAGLGTGDYTRCVVEDLDNLLAVIHTLPFGPN